MFKMSLKDHHDYLKYEFIFGRNVDSLYCFTKRRDYGNGFPYKKY